MKNVADEIGTLRAAIADLQGELKVLEDAVKYNGVTVMAGELFTVTVSEGTRKSVSYKGIVDLYAIPKDVMKRFTSSSTSSKLTCQAFPKLKLVA